MFLRLEQSLKYPMIIMKLYVKDDKSLNSFLKTKVCYLKWLFVMTAKQNNTLTISNRKSIKTFELFKHQDVTSYGLFKIYIYICLLCIFLYNL